MTTEIKNSATETDALRVLCGSCARYGLQMTSPCWACGANQANSALYAAPYPFTPAGMTHAAPGLPKF